MSQDSSDAGFDLRSLLPLMAARDAYMLEGRWRRLKGGKNPAALDALKADAAAAVNALCARGAQQLCLEYPEDLPVSAMRGEIVSCIRDHQVTILAGETGSGKTTQLPKFCLEAGLGLRGMIAHTQPRRIAARAAAARLAEEMHEPLGLSVGYKVRFSDTTSPSCRVKLMTDGMLLAETASDRLLLSYDCVIVDEAHERSLNIDFLLGYLKNLLRRRPDLKLVVTSATIDVKRFAAHFGAPVIEVKGRTYPVEILYRESAEDDEDGGSDTAAASPHDIADALSMLFHEYGPGDTLVFLPGEREISEAGEFLRRSDLKGVEILPLYARLSTQDQQRVFAPHGSIRVVLATNVAETSLTVPGIRYVIDTGLARISRYSVRHKVQRLPVEKISRASADQRSGRCGRVGPGVCVRLYDEDDYLSRPEYTEPELLRTSLAAVVLKMVSMRLGDIRRFPFIDRPEERQITSGIRQLEELGALTGTGEIRTDELRLSPIGQSLSRLPCDPKLGRMILEAAKFGCLNEVLTIASALAVNEVRLEPPEHRDAARQSHYRFRDEKSDFLAYVKLYAYLRELRQTLSSSAVSRRLKQEYISWLRVREWLDVRRQLTASCIAMGMKFNEQPAAYEEVHRALLPALLSEVGTADEKTRGLYRGARGLKFAIHPGSALFARPPKWLCAAGLAETTRVYARCCALIDPLWLEEAGAHLIRRHYAAPHWSGERGAVLATMSLTLYGLTVVQGRTVTYTDVDPALCRELLIRDGLVGGDISTSVSFYQRNRAMVEDVESLEDRVRRRDLLAEPATLEEFYHERLPAEVTTVKSLERWWYGKEKQDPGYLDFKLEDVTTANYSQVSGSGFPPVWETGRLKLPLTYVFDPTAADDGVSVHIPLTVLNQVSAAPFKWQVPGLRQELFAEIIRSLPKRLRRNLIPASEFARALKESLPGEPEGDLLEQCARELSRMGGERVTPDDFDLTRLPAHLTMTYCVEDAKGRVIEKGRDLALIMQKLRGRQREALQAAVNRRRETAPVQAWTFGTISKSSIRKHEGVEITAYPALTDRGSRGVSLEYYDSPLSQAAAMWQAERRLLMLTLPQPVRYLNATLPNKAKLAMYYEPLGTVKDLLEDLTLSAIDSLMREAGAPCWDEAEFEKVREYVRARLNERALITARLTETILLAAHELRRLLHGRIPLELSLTYADVGEQLGQLVCRGFLSATPAERLAEFPRYLKAALMRLERAPRDPARERSCMRVLTETREYWQKARSRYRPGEVPADLEAVRWMFEELRVSYFAQTLGVKGQISDKRIRNETDRVLRLNPPQL